MFADNMQQSLLLTCSKYSQQANYFGKGNDVRSHFLSDNSPLSIVCSANYIDQSIVTFM